MLTVHPQYITDNTGKKIFSRRSWLVSDPPYLLIPRYGLQSQKFVTTYLSILSRHYGLYEFKKWTL